VLPEGYHIDHYEKA
jgi:hypothetical protein